MTLEKIHENMQKKNMTVASLSRDTGLAYSTVYNIVHGNTDLAKCTSETVEKLNAALALSNTEELVYLMRGSLFKEHFTTGIPYGIQDQKTADKLSQFYMGLMMATFASANIPVNTRLEPLLDVKAEDIDFAKGERTFFCLLEDAYFNNWLTKEHLGNILWKAYREIESLDNDHILSSPDNVLKFPCAEYMEGFHNICNAAYYMDDIIHIPQITQAMEMEDTERWKEVRQLTKDAPLLMVKGFDLVTYYRTADFQSLFEFLLSEGYNPKYTKEQRDELYCMDLFRGDAQEFVRRLSMVCMDTLRPIAGLENPFVFWWKENNVLLHAACVETGKGVYFTEAADDSISYKISIHDQTKQNNLLGYMPREVIEQRAGFEDVCSQYMEKLLYSVKHGDIQCYPMESVWEYISDAPRTELRTYLFSVAEEVADKYGIVKAGEWMDRVFAIWQYARLYPENVQLLVEEYLHIQKGELTEDMWILEGMLFTSAAVPYKDKETKKWHAQTLDDEISEVTFSTKKDTLFYIKDCQRDLRKQLQNVLKAFHNGDKEEIHFQERSMYSCWVSLTETYSPKEITALTRYLKGHGVPVRKKKNDAIEAKKYEYSDIDAFGMQNVIETILRKHFSKEEDMGYQPEFKLQGTYTTQNGSSICIFCFFQEDEQKIVRKELWKVGYNVDLLGPDLFIVWPKNAAYDI